jgi:cytochrome c553
MSRHGRSALVFLACLPIACVRAAPPQKCTTTRDFFAHDVWASFMGTVCFKCHAPDGEAVTKHNARLVLQPPTYPGFLERNLATLRDVSRIEYDGVSELLRKPIGEMQHGGGSPLKRDDPRFGALQELVRRMESPETCQESAVPAALPGLRALDAQATYRKAALDLGGRLPTRDEQLLLASGGDVALDQALDALMKEPTFFERLREQFNDVLRTDKFRFRGYPRAIQMLNPQEYPAAGELLKDWDKDHWASLTDDQKRHVNDVVAREPLDLIAYVVQHDLPFPEILTADYVVVDDELARIYGVKDGQTGVRRAQVVTALGIHIPHAGILTTPAFLNRVTTTPTNRSRARARFVMKNFLATDILKISERPIDVAAVTKVDNPTMNAETCVVCHQILDPIAGGFRGWDEHDYERFAPDRPWHTDMVHPGFGARMLPSEQYGTAIQWLARQVAEDSRFDRAVAQFVLTSMTGREPLSFPGATDPDFDGKLLSWERQDAFLRNAIARFVAGQRNIKLLFKAVIESPWYRTVRTAASTAETEALGTARLLTPEALNRKIVAVTGVHWRKYWDWQKPNQDWLADPAMQLMFGGIDSDTIVERLSSVSGIMANAVQRMATETACLAVPYDFSLPPEKRALMAGVRIDEVPESGGHAVDASAQHIRAGIQALHERLLGERLTATDPEVEATWQLFLETWRDGMASGQRRQWLRYPCGLNPYDGTKLPDSIQSDPDYTVRAWTAVVAYLLSDPRFLYE